MTIIKLIRVLLICYLAGFSTGKTIIDFLTLNIACFFTAQYSVSVERPCPMETVTFTCTAAGNLLRWKLSDSTSFTIEITSTSDLNVPNFVSGYTVTLIAANDTTLTSTLSRTAENGITVSCVGFMPVSTIGSSTIRLVGELQLYKVFH